MLTCPMCKKTVGAAGRTCPTCRTDLSLLADYVDHLEEGLARADALARAGELGEAVWAYLEVLEVDPDNPTARRQVGRVAAAVRQFDRIAQGRRWLDRLRRQARRRWPGGWGRDGHRGVWLTLAGAVLLTLTGLAVGWALGYRAGMAAAEAGAVTDREIR